MSVPVDVRNTAYVTGASGSALALTMNGNTHVFGVAVNNPLSTISNVTDNLAQGYSPVLDNNGNVVRISHGGGIEAEMEVWYAVGVQPITSVTITSSGGGTDTVYAIALSLAHVENIYPVDGFAITSYVTSGATASSPTLSTTFPGIVCAFIFPGGGPSTYANSLSGGMNAINLGPMMAGGYEVTSGSGSYSASWGFNGSADSIHFIVGFKQDPPPCNYVRKLTVDHTKCGSSDSANFPVLVSLSGQNYLKTTANGGKISSSSGYDILFSSDPNGKNLLSWEVESYDGTAGTLIAWVKLPNLSHTSDTIFYMCYGAGGGITSFQGGALGAAWLGNFVAVFHLPDGTTLSVAESVSGWVATNNGATAGTGKVGGAANLNGSSQYIDLGNSGTHLNTARTLQAWIKPTAVNAQQSIIGKGFQSSGTSVECRLEITAAGKIGFYAYNGSNQGIGATTTGISAGAWTLVHGTWDGTNWKVYINGVADATTASDTFTTTNSTNWGIGVDETTGFGNVEFFGGLIDEVRLSSVARSADWVLTEYNNQNSPSTFYTVGTETLIFPPLMPELQNFNTLLRM